MFIFSLDSQTSLRMLGTHDAPALFAVIEANRAHISRHDLWPVWVMDVDGARRMIDRHMAAFVGGHGMFPGVIVDGAIAGMCGIREVDTLHGVGMCSYWLAEAHVGRGIVTRALTALADVWLLERGLLKLEIQCDVANTRSVAVAERLGFTLEGRLRGSPSDPVRLAPALHYGLLREEWAARRGPGGRD